MIKIKSNKGHTGIDIVISLGIIVITLTILVSLFFSLYLSNIEIERRTQAISYGTQILEKVSEYYYSDVTEENFSTVTLENGKKEIAGIVLGNGYDVSVNISQYNTENVVDVVKQVNVIVKYNISKKEHTLTLSTNKGRERLITPNLPELSGNLVPVKVQENNNKISYKVTSTNDTEWYNYRTKLWALAIDESEAQGLISAEDLYVWIPRYAYYNNSGDIDIQFLYSDMDKIVDSSGNLQNISDSYVIDNKFTNEDVKGYWIKVSQIETDETAQRLNNSEYGKLIY